MIKFPQLMKVTFSPTVKWSASSFSINTLLLYHTGFIPTSAFCQHTWHHYSAAVPHRLHPNISVLSTHMASSLCCCTTQASSQHQRSVNTHGIITLLLYHTGFIPTSAFCQHTWHHHDSSNHGNYIYSFQRPEPWPQAQYFFFLSDMHH